MSTTTEAATHYGPACAACGEDVELCAATTAHHTVTSFATTTTMTLPARSLRVGMVINREYYGRGERAEITSVEPWGPFVRIEFDNFDGDVLTSTPDHGFTVDAVELEMWRVDPFTGQTGDTYTMRFPTTMRRHDMLRTLASYTLATHDVGRYYTRVPRRYVRVNSAQGVAWDVRDVSSVAYFDNSGK